MFKTIALCTKNTPYEEILNTTLLPSLKKINMHYKVYYMDSLKNWEKNTLLKILVIEQALNEFKEDILVLDADCKVYHYPEIFDNIQEDIAGHILDWDSWYLNNSHIKEFLIGTLFIKNNEMSRKFVQEWKDRAFNQGKFGSAQQILPEVFEKVPELKIMNLPIEYCWINSLPQGKEPNVKRPEKVYVEHFQASRQLKRSL